MFEVCVRKALAGQKSGLKMHLPIITSFCEILDSMAFFYYDMFPVWYPFWVPECSELYAGGVQKLKV